MSRDGELEAEPSSVHHAQITPEPELEPPVLSGETELFFGMQGDRLRRRARWAGVILLLSPLIPYETVDDVPQFSWQILSELPPAAVLAAFALSLAGAAIGAASIWAKRSVVLALVALTALAVAILVGTIGAGRAAWDVLPLPDSLTDRPLSLLLGMAMAGAGLNLGFKPHTRSIGRILLASAFVVLVAFYLWPTRGERPIGTLFGLLLLLPQLPGFRYVLGYGLILVVLCFPALVAVLCGVLALTPPSREPRLLSWAMTFGFPALLALFVFRSLLLHFGDSSLPGTVGSVAVLAALLGVGAASIERIGELASMRFDDPERGSGWSTRAVLLACAAGAVTWLAVAIVLALPPKKGVAWTLGPPSAERDRLFGELLPSWSRMRAHWDRSLRSGSSAEQLVELKAKEREIEQALAVVEPDVKLTVLRLLRQSRDLDLAGRRWFRLVSDVNEANRQAGYPYYVDPSFVIRSTRDGLDRRVALRTYRIDAVRPVLAGGQSFATLHVRRLAGSGGHERLLGFSRDVQPFALVVLDEIEPEVSEWQKLGTLSPPLCSSSALASPANLACGRALARVIDTGSLNGALVAVTERHELQHQIDGPHLPLAPVVRDALAGFAPPIRERVNRELSAYLAELATPAGPVELGLVAFYRMSLGRPGTFQHFIALLAVSLLADVPVKTLRSDAEALDAEFTRLFALDRAALTEHARRAYRRGFGVALADVTAAP